MAPGQSLRIPVSGTGWPNRAVPAEFPARIRTARTPSEFCMWRGFRDTSRPCCRTTFSRSPAVRAILIDDGVGVCGRPSFPPGPRSPATIRASASQCPVAADRRSVDSCAPGSWRPVEPAGALLRGPERRRDFSNGQPLHPGHGTCRRRPFGTIGSPEKREIGGRTEFAVEVVYRSSCRENVTLRTPVICWNVAPWAT